MNMQRITSYLVIGQIIAYVMSIARPDMKILFPLSGSLLFAGEWWRVITFLFTPISEHMLFAAFAWYFLYLYGTVLEERWGDKTYALYIILSYVGGIITSLLFPQLWITNGYVYASLFFAFATLYPDMQVLLFFVIPIKIKWLAILGALGILTTVVSGNIPSILFIVLSFSNYLYFFRTYIFHIISSTRRTVATTKHQEIHGIQNICTTCGIQEKKEHKKEFRYCTDCEPPQCYCEDHINLHRHKKNLRASMPN